MNGVRTTVPLNKFIGKLLQPINDTLFETKLKVIGMSDFSIFFTEKNIKGAELMFVIQLFYGKNAS